MSIQKTLNTYLPPDPKQKSTLGDLSITGVGFLLVILSAIAIGGALLRDSRMIAKISVDAESWRISYTSGLNMECSRELRVGAPCPASPDNSSLWTSDMRRGSTKFKKAFAQKSGESYWMGVIVPAEKLRAAAQLAAPVFFLPKTNGTTSVWVDGVFQLNHQFLDQGLPAQVTLPRQRLTENRDLHIALLVSPYPHYSAPDIKTASTSEGFFTAVDADRLARWNVFYGITRNLILTGLFLLLAGVLWAASVNNRIAYDYVVGRQLALMLALISLASMDISMRYFSVPTTYRLQFVLLALEGLFILRMTSSILRLTRASSWKLALGIAGTACALFFFTPWMWIESRGLTLLTSFILPIAYGASALFVGHRAIQMYRNRGEASLDRIQFLFISTYALGATAIAYVIESASSHALEVQWSRSLNLITIYCLVRMFIRSRRTKITLVDSLPPSQYHKGGPLPEKVEGWLVHIQLSAPKSWVQTKQNHHGDPTTIHSVFSHLWPIIQLHGGEVVHHEKHGFQALFAYEKNGAGTSHVMTALKDLELALRYFSERVKIEAPEGSFRPQISFNAAIARSSAQPLWSQDGERQIVDWSVPKMRLPPEIEAQSEKPLILVSAGDSGEFSSLPENLSLKEISSSRLHLVA